MEATTKIRKHPLESHFEQHIKVKKPSLMQHLTTFGA